MVSTQVSALDVDVGAAANWGVHETRIGGQDGGSYVWDAPVKSYDDLDKLRFPRISVDHEATVRVVELADEILGDLLPVRLRTAWWWTLIHLHGLEQIMYNIGKEKNNAQIKRQC